MHTVVNLYNIMHALELIKDVKGKSIFLSVTKDKFHVPNEENIKDTE